MDRPVSAVRAASSSVRDGGFGVGPVTVGARGGLWVLWLGPALPALEGDQRPQREQEAEHLALADVPAEKPPVGERGGRGVDDNHDQHRGREAVPVQPEVEVNQGDGEHPHREPADQRPNRCRARRRLINDGVPDGPEDADDGKQTVDKEWAGRVHWASRSGAGEATGLRQVPFDQK